MSNKSALITGGATGIGKAVAGKLSARGVTVLMSGHRAEVGKAAVSDVLAAARDGAEVRSSTMQACPTRRELSCNRAATTIVAMVETNIMGVYFSMKHELAQMFKQGAGSIVNLASIAGLNGIPWAGPYGSTKHAVVGLTKSSVAPTTTRPAFRRCIR